MTYKHGNWFCKPANEAEAKEIIERAVASGDVDNNRYWAFDAECYGVYNGVVGAYDAGAEYTIEQVREKFLLPGEQKQWILDGLPPVGWHGECTWLAEPEWFECFVLPDGFVAHRSRTDLGWVTGNAHLFQFRPIRRERERWVEKAAIALHKDAVLTTEQASYAAGSIYDAIESGDLKAPEVD